MRISANKNDRGYKHDAFKYKVIDTDTNKEIRFCIIADEETGEYIQYIEEEKGIRSGLEWFRAKGHYQGTEFIPDTVQKRGNIKIIRM